MKCLVCLFVALLPFCLFGQNKSEKTVNGVTYSAIIIKDDATRDVNQTFFTISPYQMDWNILNFNFGVGASISRIFNSKHELSASGSCYFPTLFYPVPANPDPLIQQNDTSSNPAGGKKFSYSLNASYAFYFSSKKDSDQVDISLKEFSFFEFDKIYSVPVTVSRYSLSGIRFGYDMNRYDINAEFGNFYYKNEAGNPASVTGQQFSDALSTGFISVGYVHHSFTNITYTLTGKKEFKSHPNLLFYMDFLFATSHSFSDFTLIAPNYKQNFAMNSVTDFNSMGFRIGATREFKTLDGIGFTAECGMRPGFGNPFMNFYILSKISYTFY